MKHGVLRIELESKKVGVAETRLHRVGTKCRIERSGACLGEFLVWFTGYRYAKIDAVKIHDVVRFTDDKGIL